MCSVRGEHGVGVRHGRFSTSRRINSIFRVRKLFSCSMAKLEYSSRTHDPRLDSFSTGTRWRWWCRRHRSPYSRMRMRPRASRALLKNNGQLATLVARITNDRTIPHKYHNTARDSIIYDRFRQKVNSGRRDAKKRG